jgi:hypothetical protein
MQINAYRRCRSFSHLGRGARLVVTLGLTLGLASTASAATVECFAPVIAVSRPEKGAQGDFSPNVLFSQVPLGARSVGYGAAGGRSDELTIADGRLYLVRPDGAGGVHTHHVAADGEGAFMLQVISPAAWSRPVRLHGVTSLDELGKRLDDAVADAGCPNGARLAFRIEARAKAATWSLDTLPTRTQLTTLAAPVIIVGLYTTLDGARHAMPSGRRFHAHIVVPATDAAGHLQTVDLEDGATLWLQRR